MTKNIAHFPPDLKRQIRCALDFICEDPHLGKCLRDKLRGYWSYRVGHYRIIYRIHGQSVEVEIIDVGLRENIYLRAENFISNLPSTE